MILGLQYIIDANNTTYLRGVGVRDLLGVNPVFWLLVFRVVNLLSGVEGGSKVLEEVAGVVAFTVEGDVVGAVGTGVHVSVYHMRAQSPNETNLLENESVEVGELLN